MDSEPKFHPEVQDIINECDKLPHEFSGFKTEIKQNFFHYTTMEAFYGIINSRQFFLSDVTHLNDPMELVYGQKKILDHAKSYNSSELLSTFWKRVTNLNDHWNAQRKIFCISFSYEENDLSQWRSYADDGKGVCLEFTPQLVKALREKSGYNIGIIDMKYDDEELHLHQDEAIKKIEGWVQRAWPLLKDENEELYFTKKMVFSINDTTELCGSYMKHSCYSNEREMRIIAFCSFGDIGEFRLRNNKQIIPYLKVPLDLKKEKVLERIWLGPAAKTEPRTLEAMVKSSAYSDWLVPKIAESELPYRSFV